MTMKNANIYFLCSIIIILTGLIAIQWNRKREGMTSNDDEYTKLTDYTFADIQYHDDIETISKQPEIYGLPSGTSFVVDAAGNKYATLVGNDIKTNFTYYKPGAYDKFGSTKYVPSYEDSIYLSKYNTGLKPSAYSK